jgi:DNA-binding transcriptional ArsR family regulator
MMIADHSSIFELQAELCRAMGHAIRLEIVHLLSEGPKHVSELAQAMGRPQAMISQHLARLRNAGVVIGQRQGPEVYYQIVNPKIVSVCELMRQVLAEQALHRSEVMKAMEDEFDESDNFPNNP